MLSKKYNPKEVEENIYDFWLKSGIFSAKEKAEKNYTLFIPPPNVTGELHIGHTLNATIQDILARKKRMEGFNVLWVPGTDHAGIATQNVVEKKLKKEGKSRFDLGREKFIKEIWQWKEKYGGIILDQLKKIGASCDWTKTRFTMDKDYAFAVKKAFYHYWQEGYVYMGERPVNWCKRCGTSLSDLELEHKEENGKLWFIKYKLKDRDEYITVATTRPETMLGDTAVAVNPEDERYSKLVSETVIVPLVNREIPIISDRLVDPSFGTGAVKVTPAHDMKDYEMGARNKLPMIKVIDEKGRITDEGGKYKELKVEEAREKIVNDLRTIGAIEKEEDYKVMKPKCYRCGTTIETIPSRQWFIKMDKLAEKAKEAVSSGRVKFYPKNFEKIYFDWLENIRDWCISRQIWWGHRLPVWRCGDEYIVSLGELKKCPNCEKCKPEQVEDVFDTWFSSALWPFATIGWPSDCQNENGVCQPKEGSLLKQFYSAEVLTTARDIINLWVTRMIFSGIEFMGKEPFKRVYIHPTVLTKSGKRMSKSLGTGINPIELIDKYGADAVRFGLAWQLTGLQDMRFDEQNIIAGKKFANKIWNASRFVFQQVEGEDFSIEEIRMENLKNDLGKLPDEAVKIIKEFSTLIKKTSEDIEKFEMGKALQDIYHFFWHNFCDKYIELSKTKIAGAENEDDKRKIKRSLLGILLASLITIHPFMPFITEEIYQKFPARGKEKSLMEERWLKG